MPAKVSKNPAGLNGSLKNLSLNSTKSTKTAPPPDSWEEEATSPTSSHTISPPASPLSPLEDSVPGPPPPTPMSPSHQRGKSTDWDSFPQSSMPRSSAKDMSFGGNREKRPEKSNATASRMIAGALGVKGPKMTEEQKTYERVVKEKEKRRIENEKEEGRRRENEVSEAKRAVWDD